MREHFEGRLNVHEPDIVGVSEKWFSINKPAQNDTVPGYQLLTKDWIDSLGGGVALYINDQFTLKCCTIQVPDDLDCVSYYKWKLYLPGEKIAICSVYIRQKQIIESC